MLQQVKCAQCPVSEITPGSVEILEDYSRARLAHKAFGASPWGPDLSRWPARYTDAVNIIEREALEVEQALDAAVREET